MIALGWTLPDSRKAGRLPKYNPARRKTFSNSDWRHVCGKASVEFRHRGLTDIDGWINDAAQNTSSRKTDQDGFDACLCLLVALYLAEEKNCLMVGDERTGYIVVQHCPKLHGELDARCKKKGREPSEWVRAFKMQIRS
jgi:predicted RNase H-like nuclease